MLALLNVDRVALEQSAVQFRRALERSDLSFLPTLADFPKGSCGDATLLLARFLLDSGFGAFDYVCGETASERGGLQTHAWLQRGRLIIDITADQFDDVETAVLVTDNHAWHDRFQSEVKHVADWDLYDSRTRASLASAYKRILSAIDDI
jgi:hypothetical protein